MLQHIHLEDPILHSKATLGRHVKCMDFEWQEIKFRNKNCIIDHIDSSIQNRPNLLLKMVRICLFIVGLTIGLDWFIGTKWIYIYFEHLFSETSKFYTVVGMIFLTTDKKWHIVPRTLIINLKKKNIYEYLMH